jgi:hypothetical protein
MILNAGFRDFCCSLFKKLNIFLHLQTTNLTKVQKAVYYHNSVTDFHFYKHFIVSQFSVNKI